jgi:large subunit ribosomal protein L31
LSDGGPSAILEGYGRAEETPARTESPEDVPMKADLHPIYNETQVTCACGNSFQTRSTAKAISVDVCSVCHPYFTGKQRLMDTAGRVDRFRRKYQAEAAK